MSRMWLYLLVLVAVTAGDQKKLLSTPRRITAKAISPHSVEISWRDPDLTNQSGGKMTRLYIVKYKEADGSVNGSDVFESVRSGLRKVKITGLTPNTTYDIWVKAVKNKRSSTWSRSVQVTTHELQDNAYVVRNLTATPVSSGAVLLSWLLPEQANKVVAYTILTQPANGNGRQRKDAASKATLEYKVSYLQPHVLYSFRVQTMQKNGPHLISAPVFAQPFSDVPSGPPRDVTLRVIDSKRLYVTWQPPPPNQRNGQITGYTLQYKHTRSKHGEVFNATVNKDIREYSFTGLVVNETYMIQIAASTVNGSGPFTNWESVFIHDNRDSKTVSDHPELSDEINHDLSPNPPTEVMVTNKTGTSVFLSWSSPEDTHCCPIIAYKILINNYNASSYYEIVRGSRHVHLYGLIPGTLYGASVIAMSITSESRPSDEVVFTTTSADPASIVLYQITPANVVLGGEVNLTCKGRGSDVPTIDWLIYPDDGLSADGVKISDFNADLAGNIRIVTSIDQDSVVSSLLMYNITQAAEQTFLCVSKNIYGVDKRELSLIISESPKIIMSKQVTALVGANVILECEAYGRPIPQVSWMTVIAGVIYNETQIDTAEKFFVTSLLQESNNTHQSLLHINNISQHDQGNYMCIAQSKVGRAEAQVTLQVKMHPPGPVHKIQTIPLSPSRVSISWLPPLSFGYNIAYYQVSYRKKRGGQLSVFNTTRVGTELYDLDHGTEYLVGVTAGTEDGLGKSGPEVDVTTLTNDGLQPANVSVKSLNTSIIQLDWEAPPNVSSRNIRGYNVYTRREGEERIEKLFIRGNGSKQFLIGLGRDDTYYIKISTLMTWGYEAHSPWTRIQKRSEAVLPPGKPFIVSAVANLNKITLSWEPPSATQHGSHSSHVQIKGYKIIYGLLSDPLNVHTETVNAEDRAFLITDLEPSRRYIISLRAYNDVGDGEPVYTRAQTQAIPPSGVQNASAQPISSTEIHVQWTPPKKGKVTQYHIRYWRPGRKDKQSAWLTGNFQNYVAGSLRKNSNYRFEIIPYNGDLLGEGLIIFSHTYGDKPDGPPTNISVRMLNSTTIVASWKPPDPEKANGIIIGYKLALRSMGGSQMASFTVPGTEESYTILNTPVSRTYKLRVAAITANGTGVYSPWVEHVASAASERPAAPQNLTVTETETSLTLHWKPPPFTGTAVHGYIIGYGQFIPEVYRQILSASQMTYTIKALKQDSEYITSVRAFNHIGESSPTLKIVRTKAVSPLTTPLLPPVKLMVKSESPTSLLVTWMDPVLNEIQRVLDGRVYLVRFSPLSGETYTYVNTSRLQHTLSHLEPANKYEVSVKVVRGSNSSTWSLPVVNATQQIAPSFAPDKIIASSLPRNPSLISLQWSEPHSPNGKIEEYIIYLTPDPTLDIKLWIMMKTDKREVKIKDILPHTTYYFKLQARNKAGVGPLSETVTYMPPTDIRAVPTNVTVIGLYSNMPTTVKVTWSAPETSIGQVTGYLVYYISNSKDDSDWLVHTERGLDAVIVGLMYNTTYYFKVQARYSTAYGAFSKTVSYTTPPHVIKPVAVELDVRTKDNDNKTRDDSTKPEDRSKLDENNNDRVYNPSIDDKLDESNQSKVNKLDVEDRAKLDDINKNRAKNNHSIGRVRVRQDDTRKKANVTTFKEASTKHEDNSRKQRVDPDDIGKTKQEHHFGIQTKDNRTDDDNKDQRNSSRDHKNSNKDQTDREHKNSNRNQIDKDHKNSRRDQIDKDHRNSSIDQIDKNHKGSIKDPTNDEHKNSNKDQIDKDHRNINKDQIDKDHRNSNKDQIDKDRRNSNKEHIDKDHRDSNKNSTDKEHKNSSKSPNDNENNKTTESGDISTDRVEQTKVNRNVTTHHSLTKNADPLAHDKYKMEHNEDNKDKHDNNKNEFEHKDKFEHHEHEFVHGSKSMDNIDHHQNGNKFYHKENRDKDEHKDNSGEKIKQIDSREKLEHGDSAKLENIENRNKFKHNENDRDKFEHEENRNTFEQNENDRDVFEHNENNRDRFEHNENDRDRFKQNENDRNVFEHNENSRDRFKQNENDRDVFEYNENRDKFEHNENRNTFENNEKNRDAAYISTTIRTESVEIFENRNNKDIHSFEFTANISSIDVESISAKISNKNIGITDSDTNNNASTAGTLPETSVSNYEAYNPGHRMFPNSNSTTIYTHPKTDNVEYIEDNIGLSSDNRTSLISKFLYKELNEFENEKNGKSDEHKNDFVDNERDNTNLTNRINKDNDDFKFDDTENKRTFKKLDTYDERNNYDKIDNTENKNFYETDDIENGDNFDDTEMDSFDDGEIDDFGDGEKDDDFDENFKDDNLNEKGNDDTVEKDDFVDTKNETVHKGGKNRVHFDETI